MGKQTNQGCGYKPAEKEFARRIEFKDLDQLQNAIGLPYQDP
jgi:hypothetical protein